MQWLVSRHLQSVYSAQAGTSTSRQEGMRTRDKGNQEDDGSAKPTFVFGAMRAAPMVDRRATGQRRCRNLFLPDNRLRRSSAAALLVQQVRFAAVAFVDDRVGSLVCLDSIETVLTRRCCCSSCRVVSYISPGKDLSGDGRNRDDLASFFSDHSSASIIGRGNSRMTMVVSWERDPASSSGWRLCGIEKE
jgi:hypothetical protein